MGRLESKYIIHLKEVIFVKISASFKEHKPVKISLAEDC